MKTEMKNQAGFTLIELIMVIVILGILAAVALPKFVNLGSDARTAAIKAAEGSMRSTNAIIYAKASVTNKMGASASVVVGPSTISTAYGFAATVNPDMTSIMDLSLDFSSAATVITHTGATTPANCSVTYTAPATASAVPAYNTVTSGC